MTTSACDKNFLTAANAAMVVQQKGDSLYKYLALYAAPFIAAPAVNVRPMLEAGFKSQEMAFYETTKNRVGKLAAYRSNKSVLLAAAEYGIVLLDGDGKVKGKTAVEKEIKEAKGEKTPMEKFKVVMGTLATVADKLVMEGDLGEAALLTDNLSKALLTRYNIIHKKAA